MEKSGPKNKGKAGVGDIWGFTQCIPCIPVQIILIIHAFPVGIIYQEHPKDGNHGANQ